MDKVLIVHMGLSWLEGALIPWLHRLQSWPLVSSLSLVSWNVLWQDCLWGRACLLLSHALWNLRYGCWMLGKYNLVVPSQLMENHSEGHSVGCHWGVTVLNLRLFSTQDAFDDLALFFYDKHGGEVIAVLWKPSSFQPQPFKVSFCLCFKLHVIFIPWKLEGLFIFFCMIIALSNSHQSQSPLKNEDHSSVAS